MSREDSIQIPVCAVEKALQKLFSDEIKLLEASEDEKKKDIDFVVCVGEQKFTIDLKVRRRMHDLLVLEVDVFNSNRMPWIYRTQADFILFVHAEQDLSIADFYIVLRRDLLNLVKNEKPLFRRAFVYKVTDVSLLYFYDYSMLSDKVRKITLKDELV